MCLVVSDRVLWMLLFAMVLQAEEVRNSDQQTHPEPKETRPEYIHPEGIEIFDPYLKDFELKDQTSDEEDDYIPLPDNHETIEGLPLFLLEPKNSYVLKAKPATLLCRAANALQVYFKCNGARVEKTVQLEHVDPQTGVRVVEAELNVTRDELDEFFGGDRYSCDCYAWNSRGHIRSQMVFVELAYMKKQFQVSPQSASVEGGRSVTLRCVPPPAAPPATLRWTRGGVPLEASDENLVLPRITLQDMANYTCIAENIAARRESDPAVISVYVNGGWSDWSPWVTCRCGNQAEGRRRTRLCSEPTPANGGAPCRGSSAQKSDDCIQCQNGGSWSSWTGWSVCSSECVRVRRRQCAGTCTGPTIQHAACVDGLCSSAASFYANNTSLFVGIGILVAMVAAAVILLIAWCKHRRDTRPGYTMANAGIPKSCTSRDKVTGPDLTRSCNEYWMQGNDNHYDMPHGRDSYSSPFGNRSNSRQQSTGGSNVYEMKPYSPSGDSASSCYTYTRTMTSHSSDSSVPLAESSTSQPMPSKVDVAVTIPAVPIDATYRDKICLTILK